jgi:major membrane immunogen (membrane-anchored lipoprotein)
MACPHDVLTISAQHNNNSKSFFKTTKENLIQRAEMSEKDIAEGRTISAQQFKEDVENWKKERKLLC